MDIQIIITNDVLRGIVTSLLLAVVGGLVLIIVDSVREGVTYWLFKHFPKNRGKLYVMATARSGSYLDVLGLFNFLGGFPIFTVLLLMTIGILANALSGLVVSTKNISTDYCINNQCFSTGIGQNLLQENDTVGNPEKLSEYTSLNKFILQRMNNTVTAGLPWEGSYFRSVTATNFPPEIHKIPLERLTKSIEYTGIYDASMIFTDAIGLEYVNGTFEYLTLGVTTASNSSVVNEDSWAIYDDPDLAASLEHVGMRWKAKRFYLSTSTITGINLLMMSAFTGANLGNTSSTQQMIRHVQTNDTSIYITRATYYGRIFYRSYLAVSDVTLKSQGDGNSTQLEFSTFTKFRIVREVDDDELLNATLSNLNSNVKVLSNHSREMQALLQDSTNDGAGTTHNGDLLSYMGTCFIMAVSQTRPIGMVKGGDEVAGIITPVISIKLVLAIPLLLIAIVFFVPYAFVAIKLFRNNGKWLLYRLHVDTREYIINLCHSRFIVNKPRGDSEILKIIREDHDDNGPIFEVEKLDRPTAAHFL
ncbi:hypothetical protein BGX28_000605 [Mortierella sp. GBA30]|nr:hypothetical protein BGX28_000605 [Mortierella sp. GBA30]